MDLFIEEPETVETVQLFETQTADTEQLPETQTADTESLFEPQAADTAQPAGTAEAAEAGALNGEAEAIRVDQLAEAAENAGEKPIERYSESIFDFEESASGESAEMIDSLDAAMSEGEKATTETEVLNDFMSSFPG